MLTMQIMHIIFFGRHIKIVVAPVEDLCVACTPVLCLIWAFSYIFFNAVLHRETLA